MTVRTMIKGENALYSSVIVKLARQFFNQPEFSVLESANSQNKFLCYAPDEIIV